MKTKILETTKAISKAIVLVAITVAAVSTANAEKFDPVKYEMELIIKDKQLQKQLQTDANIKECKERMDRAKRYTDYVERHPELNSTLTKSVLKDCHKRVADVCGLIMAHQPEKKSK